MTKQNSPPAKSDGNPAEASDGQAPPHRGIDTTAGDVPKQDDAKASARLDLSPPAQRALAEAEERRKLAQNETSAPREIGGRQGPDPVRYGDWEKGGIASDF